ncbi:hypothetical protein LCGC14_3154120, partial [marine sediment metagenome]
MDVSMLEAAKHSEDDLERGVAKIIVESSPILEYLPMKGIQGPAHQYYREASLGTVAFRGVGGSYTPDAGVINRRLEPLVILGGEVKADNFEVEVMSAIAVFMSVCMASSRATSMLMMSVAAPAPEDDALLPATLLALPLA